MEAYVFFHNWKSIGCIHEFFFAFHVLHFDKCNGILFCIKIQKLKFVFKLTTYSIGCATPVTVLFPIEIPEVQIVSVAEAKSSKKVRTAPLTPICKGL